MGMVAWNFHDALTQRKVNARNRYVTAANLVKQVVLSESHGGMPVELDPRLR